MIPTLSGSSSAQQTGNAGSQTSNTNPVDALASESTFLKLLVAQLKNQDPAQPQDGTQFVAQLAQFSSLEQQLQMRQDLDSIKTTVQPAATPGPTSSSGSTSGSSGTVGSSGSSTTGTPKN